MTLSGMSQETRCQPHVSLSSIAQHIRICYHYLVQNMRARGQRPLFAVEGRLEQLRVVVRRVWRVHEAVDLLEQVVWQRLQKLQAFERYLMPVVCVMYVFTYTQTHAHTYTHTHTHTCIQNCRRLMDT